MAITYSTATCFKHSIQTSKDNRPVNIFYVAGYTVMFFRQKKKAHLTDFSARCA